MMYFAFVRISFWISHSEGIFFHCCSLKPFRIFLFLFFCLSLLNPYPTKNSNSFITSHIHYTSQKFNPDGFQSSVNNFFYAATSDVAALPLNKKSFIQCYCFFTFPLFLVLCTFFCVFIQLQ